MAKKLDQLGPRGARALQGRAPHATPAPGSRSRSCATTGCSSSTWPRRWTCPGTACTTRPRCSSTCCPRSSRRRSPASSATRPTIPTVTRSRRATSRSTRVTPRACSRSSPGPAAASCASPTRTPRCCATSTSAVSRPATTFEIVDKQPFGGPVSARFGDSGAGARRRARARDAGGGGAVNKPPSPDAVALPTTLEPPAAGAALTRADARRAAAARPGVRRRGRLHRPRQLRHEHRRRRQVRLPAAVGRARRPT